VSQMWRRSVSGGEVNPSVPSLGQLRLQRCLITNTGKQRDKARGGQGIPKATYSFIRALLHLFKSPPFPHPKSSTLPRKPPRPPRPPPPSATVLEARAGCAKCVIRTDFIQLLKLRKPIIRESRLCSTPTSGRALSNQFTNWS
jgi:hypothetical protein